MEAWGVPIVRLRRGTASTDRYGDHVPGPWEEEALPDGLYAPGGSTEPVAASTADTVSRAAVYWPEQWPDVTATDRLRIDGLEHAVTGRPQRWPLGLHVPVEAIERREE